MFKLYTRIREQEESDNNLVDYNDTLAISKTVAKSAYTVIFSCHLLSEFSSNY